MFKRKLNAIDKINKQYKSNAFTISSISQLSDKYHNTMDTLIDKAIRPKDDDDYYKDQRGCYDKQTPPLVQFLSQVKGTVAIKSKHGLNLI